MERAVVPRGPKFRQQWVLERAMKWIYQQFPAWKTARLGTRLAAPTVVAIGVMILASSSFAASGDEGLDWVAMAIQLAGGLAIFLYGMDKMAEALKMVAGDHMREVLGRLTTNRIMGVLTGAGVTAVIQSSSVTTVMLVSFVSADLMSLTQAIGVIFGANIGTTITAQIIAFKVTKWALLLVAAGFLMEFASNKEKIRTYGALVMGLGMIFFGLAVMSAGMKPLRTYEPFITLMQEVSNPLIGILISLTFTALVQSSSATTGVIIALATQGLISLEAGIALAFGANIGTCVTAGLACIGKPREAVRVAVAHVTFNVMGVLLVVWFIEPFADLARSISPASPKLTGVNQLAADLPRQVANAHTIFNVGATLLFLPFAAFIARFAEWAVPDRPMRDDEIENHVKQPRYLDDGLLKTPSLALGRARMEVGRMGDSVSDMMKAILPAILEKDETGLREVEEMDADVDNLYANIIPYLRKIRLEGLSEEQGQQFTEIIEAATNLESIGDIIETDMVSIGLNSIEEKVVISDATRKVITRLHGKVSRALDLATQALTGNDVEAALAVIGMKAEINAIAEDATTHCAERLVADDPNRMNTYAREVEIIDQCKRIYYFSKRMSKAVAAVSSAEEDIISEAAD